MTFKKISISPKLFLSSFIPVAFVGLFAIVAFSKITNTIIESNVRMMGSGFLSYATSKTMATLSGDMSKLDLIADVVIESKQDKNAITSTMKSADSLNPNIMAYYYVTSEPLNSDEGFLLMSDGWKAPSSFNQYDRPWYKDAVTANGEFVYNYYLNTRVNKQCIAVSKAVKSKEGKLLGVCGFDISIDSFSEVINSFKTSADANIAMINEKGEYLVSTNPNKRTNYFEDSKIGENGKPSEEYFRRSERMKTVSKTILKGDYYYSVTEVGKTPWFIAIEGSTALFKAYFSKNSKIVMILVIVISLIATFFILLTMEKTRTKEKALGDKLYNETQNLVVAAKENAATSQDQSAAVKEIVATMEDNNELSENISTKIKDVSSVASKTSSDVTDGVNSLARNVEKLHEIFDANQHTIEGIKSLGDKIENIWDIVTLINSVADQAKIIAFNAELEASSAGEAGKNFHIVATEIRRLADGIIDGTKEIKERINEIQQSSDSLILASESGTEKINEGCESAKELEEKFSSIKNASEITAGSANDITTIIQQQALASEQILITLKQIAAGVENFTQATENISNAAQNVQVIAEDLNETAKKGKNEAK